MAEDYVFNTGEFNDCMEGLLMRTYVADFETTTLLDDCRIWAYAVTDIENPEDVTLGNTIEGFMLWMEFHANARVYFHNLAFDGAFLIDYLEKNGWRWVEDKRLRSDMTYTTIISDMNQVYNITLYFTPEFKVEIYDSLKVIPLSVRAMAKSYGLDVLKGDLDYEAYRAPGHELTEEEIAYIRNDVIIVAKVLKLFIDEGLTKMTAGSNALYNFKQMMGGHKGFRKMFPIITDEQDDFIRKAYRGGFTYVNPRYAGKLLGEGIVFDVNSLYPSVMASCDGQLLPYGKPEWFDGEPKKNFNRPLWVGMVTCRFTLKQDYIPCIQLKGNFRFKQTEYLSDSQGHVTFTVTNVDWDLITEHYNVSDVEWFGGYSFKGSKNLFRQYVDKWIQVKNEAAREGNAGQRNIAKLMLNSLYGKLATRRDVCSRRPVLVDDVVKYVDLEPEEREPVYLPGGVFITSYARFKTISSAQKVYDRFVYADTDSLHLMGTEIPDSIKVDPFNLGEWKHESTFTQAKFLRAKCYCEQEEGKENLTVHVAGMPDLCHDQVTLDNFKFGAVYEGKLYQHRVNGGIVLVPGEIQIRE